MAYLTKSNSMNVAADKGVCLYFQTKKQTGTWTKVLDDVYVKGPKKGQNKTAEYPIYGEYIYNTLAEAWYAASDFKQVSSGRTNQIREVVIVDYDRPKDSNGNVIPDSPTFLEMIPKWTEICNNNDIPTPNYWVENPLTRNGQFGWFINITSVKDRIYMDTVHKVNRLFGGDSAFTGWQCKNPYYDGLNTIWNNEKSIIDINVFSKITISSFIDYHNNKVSPTTLKEKVKVMSKKGRRNASNEELYSTSRHVYLRKYLTEYIWKYMRTHNGIEPSQDKIEAWAFSIAKDAAEYTGKGEMHSATEIKRNMQSISEWATRMFKMPDSKKGKFTEESRNLAKLVRKCKKFIAYREVMGMSGSTREVARQTGLSQKTIVEYRNMSSEEVEMLILFAWSFIDYLENDKVKDVKDEYIDMYNAIKTLLSSSFDYHNNKVSPSEISNTVNEYVGNIGILPYQTINDITYSAEDLNEKDRKLEFCINGKTLGLKEDGKIYGYAEQNILDFNEWVAYTKWAV